MHLKVEDNIERLRYLAEYDALTGIYNKNKFFEVTKQMLSEAEGEQYVFIRFDIARFQLVNSFYGTEQGDAILCKVAERLREKFGTHGRCTYGRMEADVFACCMTYESREEIDALLREDTKHVKEYLPNFDLVPVFGIYYLDDLTLPVNTMLDRAAMAAKSKKGRYTDVIGIYDPKMSIQLETEQTIMNEMHGALAERQFCVYFQPKYNLELGVPDGAEALVRWNHPEKGMISPGVFIPVFEKNGYIGKLDYYVWDEVCRLLRKWIDEGLSPKPISVNMFRVNLYNMQIVDILSDLLKKYDLSCNLLQLELTESVYMDNPESMKQVIAHLKERGFTVLMDDFGSGYSSLNTLKDIDVDILKVDMKFLPTNSADRKSAKILASVIRMAKWIGMDVVVEGVETKEQEDFLESIGCGYIQGFYYARPMPVEEYERLLLNQPLKKEFGLEREDGTMSDGIWAADTNIDMLLKNIADPVVIYEYSHGEVDGLRVNKAYTDVFGYKELKKQMSHGEYQKLLSAFAEIELEKSVAECECFLLMVNGIIKWYRIKLQYMEQSKSGILVCGMFNDITEEKQLEMELRKIHQMVGRRTYQEPTMLIVDDSDASRQVLSLIFQERYHIVEAENGLEALEYLKHTEDEVEIILLDMIMPRMGGAEFLSAKNEMQELADIPVVVISVQADENIQVNMLQNGVHDYITKPFIPEIVERRIRNVLEYSNRFAQLLKEYKSSGSMSMDMQSIENKSIYTMEEMKNLLSLLDPIFDVVRVVEPGNTSVMSFDEDGEVVWNPYSCFRVWDKENRCENCTSICAKMNHCQMTKYEFIENNIFYVVSRSVMITQEGKAPLDVVLEIVSHISDHLLMREEDGKSMRQLLEETRQKIYSDVLTSAYNKRYFQEMLFLHTGRMDTASRIALIMLDLTGFKEINDREGHVVGDQVLIDVADMLKKQLRGSDSVIRYGGDEFIVVLTECEESQVEMMVHRLRKAVGTVTYGENGQHHAHADFGYSYREVFEQEEAFLKAMVEEADADMYRDKMSDVRNPVRHMEKNGKRV